MISKHVSTAILAVAVTAWPVSEARADTGDFVAGAVVGGIAGHLITKESQRNRATTSSNSSAKTQRTYRSTIPSTQEGREVQTSLNYFGFDAGAVDGQLGRRSRAAISQYQAYLGYPATGNLTVFEQNLLVTSYNRAIAGGYATTQQAAALPDGTRGLLRQYRAEMAGAPTGPQVTASVPMTTVVVAPQASAAAPQSVAALPNFQTAQTERSLASHCNTISLVTTTNGGFTTAANMTDAGFALNEQFCLARTYAVAEGEQLAAKVQGFTPDQIEAQCAALGPAMTDHVAALTTQAPEQVVQGVGAFVLSSGMAPDQLKNASRICLGLGYRKDDMDVALGSALLLYSLGEPVYGELIGHHLSQGFGTDAKPKMSLAWYDAGIAAVENGAEPIIAPGQPERTELIRKASHEMVGGGSSSAAQPASALPAFTVSE